VETNDRGELAGLALCEHSHTDDGTSQRERESVTPQPMMKCCHLSFTAP
jgi:hypothetical protein